MRRAVAAPCRDVENMKTVEPFARQTDRASALSHTLYAEVSSGACSLRILDTDVRISKCKLKVDFAVVDENKSRQAPRNGPQFEGRRLFSRWKPSEFLLGANASLSPFSCSLTLSRVSMSRGNQDCRLASLLWSFNLRTHLQPRWLINGFTHGLPKFHVSK